MIWCGSGQAVATMNVYGTRVKVDPQNYYYPAGSAPADAAFQVSERDLLYPVPIGKIIINRELMQNTGY